MTQEIKQRLETYKGDLQKDIEKVNSQMFDLKIKKAKLEKLMKLTNKQLEELTSD